MNNTPSTKPQTDTTAPVPQVSNTKPPIGVKIISWILLLGGLYGMPFGLMLMRFDPLGFFILGIAIGQVILAFWIRRMRRAALVFYTVLIILQIPLAVFYGMFGADAEMIIKTLIHVVAVIYLWTIAKRFT